MKTKLFALTLLGGATLFAAPALANRHVYIGPAYDPGFYTPEVYPVPYAVVPPPVYVAPPVQYEPPPVVEYVPPPVVEYEPGPAIGIGE
jgi:hypothetical protein